MKKIIAILTLSLAFSLSANAQDKKVISKAETTVENPSSSHVSAKNDAQALIKFLGLPENQTDMFTKLFFRKYSTLEQTNLSTERKDILKSNIDAKLRATLTPEQMEKLDKNPALLKRLTE